MPDTFEYDGTVYDVTFGVENEMVRHGGPFDRGSADSYYRRMLDPHYFVSGTNRSERVGHNRMTQAQIKEYHAGHEYNEVVNQDWKDWG